MAVTKKKSFREIARSLNVSPATVSRIAAGIGSFSEETRQTVLSALAAEGYSPQAEKEPSAPAIAAVVTDLSNELYNNILTCLTRYLGRKGYLLRIYLENQSQEELITHLQSEQPAGIILLGTPLEKVRAESFVPLIQVLSSSAVSYQGKVYRIFSDEYVGGRLAARLLLEKGCHRPVILNNRHTQSSESRRIRGFKDEWDAEAGSSGDIYIHDGELFKSAFNSAHDIVSYLLAKGQDFDSIFACSDWRAYGALVALRDMNVPVPEKVRVVGFDGERVSRYCDQPFATIQQNPDMIATEAMQMLLSLIDGREVEKESRLVPVQVQRGMTV